MKRLIILFLLIPSLCYAAEFGWNNTTGDTSTGSYVANWTMVSQFNLPENGTVSQLSAYIKGTSATCKVKGLIFSNDGTNSTPMTLQGVTNENAAIVNGTPAWYNLTFSSPPYLTAGNYSIGWISGGPDVTLYMLNIAGHNLWKDAAQHTTTLNYNTPGNFNATGVTYANNYVASIFATYTPGNLTGLTQRRRIIDIN